MKKIFGILLLAAFCVVGLQSCYASDNSGVHAKAPVSRSRYESPFGAGYSFKVIVVDSCEYIFLAKNDKGFLAHKGNCKYCEQRRKREQNKLFERIRDLLKSEEMGVTKPIESRVFEY